MSTKSIVPGMDVKIVDDDGITRYCTVSSKADFGNLEPMWWVEVDAQWGVATELRLVTEEDLIYWNKSHFSGCTCGSAVLKHPGHSIWCDLEVWK